MKVSKLANPNNPAVRLALSKKCPICEAAPKVWCHQSINPKRRLVGRIVHHARCEFKDGNA